MAQPPEVGAIRRGLFSFGNSYNRSVPNGWSTGGYLPFGFDLDENLVLRDRPDLSSVLRIDLAVEHDVIRAGNGSAGSPSILAHVTALGT
jgi:hypothetical protein